MKPTRRNILLILSILGSIPTQAQSSYIVEGVDVDTITASTRFYDTGKGYYWTSFQDELNSSYNNNGAGNYNFLGDWASYPDYTPETSFSITQMEPLRHDANTCWYQAAANLITYWQTYYGVFYTGSNPLPTGYTYDKSLLTGFGGTQSLDVAKLFYDNWSDAGGNIQSAASWYFSGNTNTSSNHATLTGNADTSFFKNYFNNAAPIKTYHFGENGTGDLASNMLSRENAATAFNEAFGAGADATTTPGTLGYLGITSKLGGHALTCYGYTTNEYNEIESLLLANSDDQEYGLFELYVELEDSQLRLYRDKDRTTPWEYANTTDWTIRELSVIDTPEALQELYDQYADIRSRQVWNGELSGSTWASTYDRQQSAEDLPGADTGWDIYATYEEHSGHFHTWYNEARGVEFKDYPGADQDINVSGEIKADTILLSANTYDYTFQGAASDSITADYLDKTGTRHVTFTGLALNIADTATIAGGTMQITGGSSLTTQSVIVNSRSDLLLDSNATLQAVTTTVNTKGTLIIGEGGVSMSTSLSLADGACMSFILSDTNITSAALTLTGSLTLGGNVNFLFNESALTDGTQYALIYFTNGWSTALEDMPGITLDSGALTFNNNTLFYTYAKPTELSWSTTAGNWSSTSWNGENKSPDGANLTFHTGASVTINGTVVPGSITITSSGTRFIAGEGASINGTKAVSLSANASLTSELALAGRRINLGEGATLRYVVKGSNTISEIDMAATSTLSLEGDSGSTHAIESADSMAGHIEIKSGNTLSFHLAEDKTISGTISTASDATLAFRNSSAGRDITYTLTQGTSQISGNIIIGHQEDICSSVLEIGSDTSACYQLAENGTLRLAGGSAEAPLSFTGKTTGSGTVQVGEDAHVSFAHTGLDTSTHLHIMGTATMGGAQGETVQGRICDHIHVDGGALLIRTDLSLYLTPTKPTALTLDRLTLSNGGEVTINYDTISYLQSFDETASIGTLHAGPQGGRLGAGFFLNGHYEQADIYPVHRISRMTGSGDITFFKTNKINSSQEAHTSTTIISDITAFTGNIIIESLRDIASTDQYLYLNAAEFTQSGDMKGTISVNGQSDDNSDMFYITQAGSRFYAHNDPGHRALLGLNADMSISGLNGNADAYLYAGHLNKTSVKAALIYTDEVYYKNADTVYYNTKADRAQEAENIAQAVTRSEQTLTIHNNDNHDFKGTVLSGISLVKQGAGTQSFSGDTSRFDGDVTIESGTLTFAAPELNIRNLEMTAGATLQTGGVVMVQGDVTVNAASLSAIYKASTLEVTDITFAGSTSIDSDLDLSHATSLSLGAAIDLGGHALTMNTAAIPLALDLDALGLTPNTLFNLTLFTEVSQITNLVGTEWKAANYFTSDYISDESQILFQNQAVILTKLVNVPEPTTPVLTLTGLAALLLRRRRK